MSFASALAGTAMGASAIGSVIQGEGEAQSADYMSQVAANNEKIARNNANMALEQGTQAQEQAELQTGQQMGMLRTRFAASGVTQDSGSALNVKSSAAEMGELNAENIGYNANVQAWNDMNQASAYGAQSQLYQSQASYDMMGSIRGGASNVSSKWLSWQTEGGTPGGSNPIMTMPNGMMING